MTEVLVLESHVSRAGVAHDPTAGARWTSTSPKLFNVSYLFTRHTGALHTFLQPFKNRAKRIFSEELLTWSHQIHNLPVNVCLLSTRLAQQAPAGEREH